MSTPTSRRTDGTAWTDDYQELPGSAGVSLIVESTAESGTGEGGYEAIHIHASPTFVTEWLE